MPERVRLCSSRRGTCFRTSDRKHVGPVDRRADVGGDDDFQGLQTPRGADSSRPLRAQPDANVRATVRKTGSQSANCIPAQSVVDANTFILHLSRPYPETDSET